MLDPAEQLAERFTHHPPHGDQADRYTTIREHAMLLAMTIEELCPPSREKSLAQTAVQQASMWANAAIAITEAPAGEGP